MNWDLLFNYIQPSSFIDIGAHVGDFTYTVKSKFPKCECLMIEANPYCEPYLKLNGNSYVMAALTSKRTKLPLFVEKINKIGTGASLYKENTRFYEEGKFDIIEVETETLDSLNISPSQMIDLIKIDTQGSELDVLLGGEKTFKRSKYILIEVSLVEYNIGSPLIDNIMKQMREYHFKIEDIIGYHYNNNQIFQMDVLFKNLYI